MDALKLNPALKKMFFFFDQLAAYQLIGSMINREGFDYSRLIQLVEIGSVNFN